MKLASVSIENCRKIETANLDLSPSINLIIGKNGSGKTSIVEALSILSSGRSFQTRSISEVIKSGREKLLITAKLEVDGTISHVGIEKHPHETRIRINKKNIRSQAELSQYIPVTIIHPDSIKLIVGSPKERRSYLDWIGFYLLPEYHQQWKHHQRILKQRNAYLRTQNIGDDFDYWTRELIAAQSILHEKRLLIVSLLSEEIDFFRELLLSNSEISVDLSNGFSKVETFEDCNTLVFYQSKLQQELKMRRTLYGIHRSDMGIFLDNSPAHISASRGQLKLLSTLLLLAQSNIIRTRDELSGLVIVDDMTSELDEFNQSILLDTLNQLKQQVLLTAPVLSKVFNKYEMKMFHVKHGVIFESGS